MERFLVTGGAGFIGSNIVRRLVEDCCFVRVIDNLSTGKVANLAGLIDKIEFIQADMGEPEVAREAMNGIDVVLHHGALPSVPRSVEDPAATHRHCVDATFSLLLAARDAKVRRFVYAASSSAYGESPTLPKVESMAPEPLSPYAVGKLAGEYYCTVFSHVYGLQTICLRYFNVFGPNQDPTSQYAAAIPAFVTAILKGKQPIVYGDGTQTRDFTYIDNVVHANLLAARVQRTCGQVVNIGCGRAISINSIIELINRTIGTDIRPIYAPPRCGDIKHSLAGISLAKEVLGYEPIVGFEEGLRRTIDWYRANLV